MFNGEKRAIIITIGVVFVFLSIMVGLLLMQFKMNDYTKIKDKQELIVLIKKDSSNQQTEFRFRNRTYTDTRLSGEYESIVADIKVSYRKTGNQIIVVIDTEYTYHYRNGDSKVTNKTDYKYFEGAIVVAKINDVHEVYSKGLKQ